MTEALTVLDRLQSALSRLSLSGVGAVVEAHLERASKEGRTYAEFLCDLLEEEVSARSDRYLETRIRLARLPYRKTFEEFEFAFQPSVEERRIKELATLRFLHDAENVCFLGPPGVGKTHMAVSLSLAAMKAGYSAYFISAQDLVTDLGEASREGKLSKRLQVYLRPKLLVIDEMGYLPLDQHGGTILFQLVSARYLKGSIILTSNKSYGEWGSVFGDPVLASAILDRLLHHSTTINIRGESYRLKERRKAGLISSPLEKSEKDG
jgi:DNA replication protein DnaC